MATAPIQPGRAADVPRIVQPPRQPRRSGKRWVRWALALGVGATLVVVGVLWRAHSQNQVVYQTVPIERGSIQSKITATGNLNAVVDVLVSSQVSGNIQALYADWNSKVKKGQLIALIDPEIFQAQVDQAKAVYGSAQASAVAAQAQVQKSKSDLSAAYAAEKNAQAIVAKNLANEVNAASQWERADRLFREGIIARQDYDTAKANYDAARAQVSADQAQVDAARQNTLAANASVRVAQSQSITAQAAQRQAQAALQQAQINLDHCQVYAPVDGTVIARRMDVGQTVASTLNPPTIFEIAQDLTKMQVDTNVYESDVGAVTKGQKATFTVDSYPATTFGGLVADVRKAPIITQNVVTYDVVITVDNSELKLFPGMTANVTIFTAKLDDTLKVPNAALRFRPSPDVLAHAGLASSPAETQQVFVLAGDKLEAVPVRFGLSDGKYTAISSGTLKEGQRIVVKATPPGTPTARPSATSPTPVRM